MQCSFKMKKTKAKTFPDLDISTSSQVSNCNGVELNIYTGSQIQATTGGFVLRIYCIRSSYLTQSAIRSRLGRFGKRNFIYT